MYLPRVPTGMVQTIDEKIVPYLTKIMITIVYWELSIDSFSVQNAGNIGHMWIQMLYSEMPYVKDSNEKGVKKK
jgi:hypothetical protein